MTDSPVVPAAAAALDVAQPGVPRVNVPPSSEASRWRMRLASARPAWADEVERIAASRITRSAIAAQLAIERGNAWRDEAHLFTGLRHLRAKALAALIDRDLDGRADLAEVMEATTALAEIAIGEALRFLSHALASRHGVSCGRANDEAQDLVVIGMGKLGGGELNVSSDIDLIFVYREDGETTGSTATDASARGPGPAALRIISNEEFFTRLGRRLIAALAEVTADGFVFRVDMRLRPDGDSGPLVTHFAMLEHYLIASARDWERFAWIKARIVSPAVFAAADNDVRADGRDDVRADVRADGRADAGIHPRDDASASLARLVQPFVYRRYLDFGAIDALRKLHDQIREEAARREAIRNERSARYAAGTDAGAASSRIDVKLGRGGIREIEFIAQHFQLIRGGREPALRLRPTLATLAALVHEELIDEVVATRLRDAYVFLRNVEHRLQYLDDAQTHTLPARDAVDDCDRVAAMCARLVDPLRRAASRSASFDALLDALETHRDFVAAQFDGVFGLDDEQAGGDAKVSRASGVDLWGAFSEASPLHARDEAAANEVRAQLVAAGFDPPDGAFARLAALARSARLRTIAKATRARLDSLVPRVIESAIESTNGSASGSASAPSDPTATLGRWFDLIEAIAGRSAYLALLEEFSVARRAVTRLLSASPWAAQYLTRHPLLLDDLIDARDEHERPRDAPAWAAHWRDVAAALSGQLDEAAADTERQMDVLRETHHAETFRLLIDDLDGRLTIEALSDQLSALADLILDAAIRACWASLARQGPNDGAWREQPAFAVIGFGKLGGKELGYASDLDLVFLYDDGDESDRGLAVQRYARFAQRLNLWLTARTTAGALFDIDLRLRPDGAAGLVVSSFASWAAYERRENDVGAWTWEHQALTRARFCAGDRTLAAAFEAERVAILIDRAPDEAGRAQLRVDVVAMRKKMHDGHPNRSGLFDLKHDEGGMVDIEFSVQYLVLAFGDAHRELLANAGNIALLSRAADAGLVDGGDARGAADAYRVYRARQHASRLADPQARAARVPGDALADERAVVRRLWVALFDNA